MEGGLVAGGVSEIIKADSNEAYKQVTTQGGGGFVPINNGRVTDLVDEGIWPVWARFRIDRGNGERVSF
jgi:hypothetical protein